MDRSRMPRVLRAEKRIECVRQYKYLGVILDSVSNFVERAKCVRAKVSTYMFSLKAHVGRSGESSGGGRNILRYCMRPYD